MIKNVIKESAAAFERPVHIHHRQHGRWWESVDWRKSNFRIAMALGLTEKLVARVRRGLGLPPPTLPDSARSPLRYGRTMARRSPSCEHPVNPVEKTFRLKKWTQSRNP